MPVKVDFTGFEGEMIVRFPGRTFEQAHRVIEALRDKPPEGYRMDESRVQPRGRAGRRCNIRLTFSRNDDRVPPLATSGAKEYFAPYMLDAQGVDT